MKWRIKNPAPIGPRLTKWGDYHFGRSLAKYLERLGEEVETDYYPKWEHDGEADVVLVLRGRRAYTPRPGSVNLMWNISHPADVPPEEYELYDHVFIASRNHAANIAARISKPVEPLLQCTDTEIFFPPEPGAARDGFIFVGNSRNVERPGVIWAVDYGLPLRIWGAMWENFIPPGYVVAKSITNEELGGLYRQARLTLNDHWDDMKAHGFINNRCFDAMACGLPFISDYHSELHDLFPDSALYYRDREGLLDAIHQALINYPALKVRTDAQLERIRKEFSFEARARRILDAVRTLQGRPEGI